MPARQSSRDPRRPSTSSYVPLARVEPDRRYSDFAEPDGVIDDEDSGTVVPSPDNASDMSAFKDVIIPSKADHKNPIVNDEDGVHVGEYEHGSPATAVTDDILIGKLSLYERKALLIDAELLKMGMGRYQICIWFLCGFGYMLDLLWAQAFGLIATPIYKEFGVSGGAEANIFTAFSAGLTVGALVWGLLVDIIGRRWAFNLTCIITSLFGMLAAAPSNYKALCAITAFCGFGLGGNIPIDATITLEFLPQNRRWLLPLLSTWQPIGVILCCAISLGLVPKYSCAADATTCSSSDNMGWRYLLLVLGCITFAVFMLRFVVFTFHESPKYLLARGKDAEAITVIKKIAAFNRQPEPTLTIADFERLDAEFESMDENMLASKDLPGRDVAAAPTTKDVIVKNLMRFKHLKGLFRTKRLGFTTVLLWVVYMGDFWSFNLAGSFLPIILARNGAKAGQSVIETYRQYVYIYTPGIIGTVGGALMVEVPGVGRKWSLVFGAIIQGIAMALYTQAKTIKASVGLNALEYIAQSFFNAVLYGFTPEIFPAPIRGSAGGICSTWGRLSGIVAPQAAKGYLNNSSSGVLWLACGGIWLSAFLLVFLPVETRKRASY